MKLLQIHVPDETAELLNKIAKQQSTHAMNRSRASMLREGVDLIIEKYPINQSKNESK